MNSVQKPLAFLDLRLPISPCALPNGPAWRIANYRLGQTALVAPCWAPHFSCLPKKSKQKKAPRHPGLRFAQTPLAPVLLRGSSRRAVLGPSRLIWHPCQMPLYTAPPLGLLTGPVRRPKPCCSTEDRKSCRRARTNGPVRRVSGIGVEGVERHGCRERRDGTRMSLRDVPLKRRWSERTPSAQRLGPHVGRVFSLLTFSLRVQRESEAPCKAQQEIEYLKNVAAKLPANGIKKAPDYQSSNTPTPSQTMHRGHKACDRAASYAAATCTGTPLSAALPERASRKRPSVRSLAPTPGRRVAMSICTPC